MLSCWLALLIQGFLVIIEAFSGLAPAELVRESQSLWFPLVVLRCARVARVTVQNMSAYMRICLQHKKQVLLSNSTTSGQL